MKKLALQKFKKKTGEKFGDNHLEFLTDNQNDYYISFRFTNLDKIGLNPKQNFDTPIAICSYTLTPKTLSQYATNKIGYAGYNKYLYVYRTRKDNTIILDSHGNSPNYNESNYREDLTKIRDWYPDIVTDTLVQDSSLEAFNPTPFGKLWNLTRTLSLLLGGKSTVKWTKLLIRLGIYAVIDQGSGILHKNEPSQTMIFKPIHYDLLFRVRNKNDVESVENTRLGKRKLSNILVKLLNKDIALFNKLLRSILKSGISTLDLSRLSDISDLSDADFRGFQNLDLSECKNLVSISNVNFSGIQILNISDCNNLKDLSRADFTGVQNVNLSLCRGLVDLSNANFTDVRVVNLAGCINLNKISEANFTGVSRLNIGESENLTQLGEELLPIKRVIVPKSLFKNLPKPISQNMKYEIATSDEGLALNALALTGNLIKEAIDLFKP